MHFKGLLEACQLVEALVSARDMLMKSTSTPTASERVSLLTKPSDMLVGRRVARNDEFPQFLTYPVHERGVVKI